MEEPSVLDYIKSKLIPWKYERLELPAQPTIPEIREPASGAISAPTQDVVSLDLARPAPKVRAAAMVHEIRLPIRSFTALIFAFAGQFFLGLDPVLNGITPERNWVPGTIFLALAIGSAIWAALAGELNLALFPSETSEVGALHVNVTSLLMGGILAASSFIVMLITSVVTGILEFTWFNILLLGLALILVIRGFSNAARTPLTWVGDQLKRIQPPPWQITIRASTLGAIALIAVAAFFRFYRLSEVPPEMNSDHAEKILDVLRVLSGQALIFFPNNGGREGLQFYLVAGLHRLLGFPLNFLTLKLVTSLVGFLALPFLYLLGKELGNHRVGMLALLTAGIAYWPNVVSRVGLRLPFYMLFTAALMYFLVHGIRQAKQDDFVYAGITLGLGFYGYSADRILPLLVLVAIGLALVHCRSGSRRKFLAGSLLVIVIISVVIFLPLFNYILANPESFFERTLTRMGNMEREISAPVLVVFFQNTGRALAMFSWDAGVVWPISIPGYPALSVISGGLFYLGAALILLRYLRSRNWVDLFMLLAIPILMLPSIMALAFPDENPNLYRTSGAFVPVFLMVALALDSIMSALTRGVPGVWGTRLAFGLAVFLVAWNAGSDYGLVFGRYNENYRMSSWNSTEMGEVARDFIALHQSPENVWVIGYPNWVDTRLVANNAGFPGRDYELKAENIPDTNTHSGPELFLLNPQDHVNLAAIQELYPDGRLESYQSKVATKDFLIFYVLPRPNDS